MGLIGSLTWLKISLDDAKSRNPDAAVVTFMVYFLVGAIVDICILVRIKRDLGTGWAVAAFFLWMVVLPVALYKMFRLPEGRSPIGTLSAMAIAAIL
ncbi:MAG TPA: hypothetical protein PK819_07270, partial [Thermomicrobiales bacterium]|nr:hypothetical protein [Thermomicrobiales bacterium]